MTTKTTTKTSDQGDTKPPEGDTKPPESAGDPSARVAELEAELRQLREAAAAANAPKPDAPTHRIFYVCGCEEDTAVPAGTHLDCKEHDGIFPVVSTMLIRKGV